jgi:hypothetical protein
VNDITLPEKNIQISLTLNCHREASALRAAAVRHSLALRALIEQAAAKSTPNILVWAQQSCSVV